MITRHTDATGITIGAHPVYNPTKKRNVTAWGHFDCNDGHPRHVGPWYYSKAEILADHENYLVRAGWLKPEHVTGEPVTDF